MTALVPSRPTLGPIFALENDPIASVLAACAAIGIHAALALGATSSHAPASLPPIVSEIELQPPPPPEPPPPPPKEPEREDPVAAPTAAKAAAPPAAARAGPLLTATPAPNAPSSPETVDFVDNPMGTSYGSGVVAQSGTADHGIRRATAAPGIPNAPGAAMTAPGGGITPAASLSRAARLEVDDPCRGHYPNEATADSGDAAVQVVVAPSGRVERATIASESVAGQGFGAAARRCLLATSFAPALDKAGNKVTAQVTVRVRFTR